MTTTPVIKCESVYKIFGANAEKMLQNSNGNVDAKIFQDAGCIVGVNNAFTLLPIDSKIPPITWAITTWLDQL